MQKMATRCHLCQKGDPDSESLDRFMRVFFSFSDTKNLTPLFRQRVVVSSSCVFVVVVVVLPAFQLFCSMTAAISLLLSVVYQRVIVKSCDVCFQLPHLPKAALETIISVFFSPSQNQLSISRVLYGTCRIVIKCNFCLPCQFFSSS